MIYIETDEEETEITCIPSSSGNRVFPDSFTAITLEGEFSTFMKDANGEAYLKEDETINKLIKERKTATGDRKNFIDNLLDE